MDEEWEEEEKEDTFSDNNSQSWPHSHHQGALENTHAWSHPPRFALNQLGIWQ